MLVLCSDGLSGKSLLNSVRRQTRDCKTAALVVTADPVYKEKNYHVPRCRKELEALGLGVDVFDLDTQPAETLLEYDVVEFIGGNPYYLLNSIRTHDASDVLRWLAENRMLIGWSAADFVFGPTLELVDMYSPEMNFLGLTNLKGLGLTDVEVLPHYRKFLNKFASFEEKCRDYEHLHGKHVIRLNDGDGVLIEADKVFLFQD